MDVEKRIDEMERDLEDIKDDLEELQEESEEEEDESENRTLYLYIVYEYQTAEGLFTVHGSKVVVLVDDEYGYQIPQTEEDSDVDTLQQALNLGRSLGVDSWESVELVAEDEDSSYYKMEVSEEILRHVGGYIIDSSKAVDLVSEYEERRHL